MILINFLNTVNMINHVYMVQLNLQVQKTHVYTQKIDNFFSEDLQHNYYYFLNF